MSDAESGHNLTVSLVETDMVPLFERTLQTIREDFHGNPYIDEALRVLPVKGYRSAIGSFGTPWWMISETRSFGAAHHYLTNS